MTIEQWKEAFDKWPGWRGNDPLCQAFKAGWDAALASHVPEAAAQPVSLSEAVYCTGGLSRQSQHALGVKLGHIKPDEPIEPKMTTEESDEAAAPTATQRQDERVAFEEWLGTETCEVHFDESANKNAWYGWLARSQRAASPSPHAPQGEPQKEKK